MLESMRKSFEVLFKILSPIYWVYRGLGVDKAVEGVSSLNPFNNPRVRTESLYPSIGGGLPIPMGNDLSDLSNILNHQLPNGTNPLFPDNEEQIQLSRDTLNILRQIRSDLKINNEKRDELPVFTGNSSSTNKLFGDQ